MSDVGPGLGKVHAGHGVAQPDALIEGGESAELDAPAQGGLADKQAGERTRVHLRAGQQPQLLELLGVEEVGFVDLCRSRDRSTYADDATMPTVAIGRFLEAL